MSSQVVYLYLMMIFYRVLGSVSPDPFKDDHITSMKVTDASTLLICKNTFSYFWRSEYPVNIFTVTLKILLKNLFEGDNLNCLIKYFNDKFYTLKYPEKEKISDVQKIVDALNKNLDLFKNKNFDKLIRTADNIF